MTTKTKIDELKLLAKRYAHATRSNHREALDAIAAELGFPHWKALTVKAKQGWMPSGEELAKADTFVREFLPSLGGKPQFIEQSMSRPVSEPIKAGEIDGYVYKLFEFSGDIRMEGDGWRILIGEADFSHPVVAEVGISQISLASEEVLENGDCCINLPRPDWLGRMLQDQAASNSRAMNLISS